MYYREYFYVVDDSILLNNQTKRKISSKTRYQSLHLKKFQNLKTVSIRLKEKSKDLREEKR
jgi:hypothetical protein